jgi:hypothetical protein
MQTSLLINTAFKNRYKKQNAPTRQSAPAATNGTDFEGLPR